MLSPAVPGGVVPRHDVAQVYVRVDHLARVYGSEGRVDVGLQSENVPRRQRGARLSP